MKRLVTYILLFASLTCAGQSQPSSAGFNSIPNPAKGYYRSLTVDHNKVPNTDQTDIPVLFSGTYTYLKTIANGGKVNNVNGYDIVFSTDNAAVSLLSWEIEYYDPTSGTIVAWIKNTLTHSTDYVFYLGYGNSKITTFQGNVTGTWSAYSGVYHFANGTILSVVDATGTANGSMISSPTATVGQMDGAAALNGSSQYISLGNNFGFIGDMTIEAWLKPTDLTVQHGILSKTASNQPGPYDFSLATTTGIPHFVRGNGAGANDSKDATTGCTSGVWNSIAVTASGTSSRVISFFLNGATNGGGTMNSGGDGTNTANNADVGTRSDFGYFLKGGIDELRVSNTAKSADWLATEYNNQSSPSTFYTIGSETAL